MHIWLSIFKQIEALLWPQACNMLLLYCQTGNVFHMEVSGSQSFIMVFIFAGLALLLSQFVFIEQILDSLKSVCVVTGNAVPDS